MSEVADRVASMEGHIDDAANSDSRFSPLKTLMGRWVDAADAGDSTTAQVHAAAVQVACDSLD